MFKYNRNEAFSKMFVNFMCVHNYGYCYGNEVEGDEDDDGNYYTTPLFMHSESTPIFVERAQHNICEVDITAESAFRC